MPPLFVRGCACERIDSIVFDMPAVAFYPMPFDLVGSSRIDQFLPELCIFDGFLVRRAPAVLLPVVHPAGYSITHIGAVRMKLHSARALQRFEAFDRREQFHSIVGGQRFTSGQLALLLA